MWLLKFFKGRFIKTLEIYLLVYSSHLPLPIIEVHHGSICSPIEYDKQACNIVLSKIIKIIKILGIEKIEMLIPFFLAKSHFPNATLLWLIVSYVFAPDVYITSKKIPFEV